MEVEIDSKLCGKRRHSFWDDPVGNLLTYLCEPRFGANKILAIAHNAKAFDQHFILNRAIRMKWKAELITIGLNMISMEIEHIVFLDNVSFLPRALRKLPEAFGVKATKSWYPHYFNTEVNLDYVGPMPDISYYGVDDMSNGERKEFLAWYDRHNSETFDNRRTRSVPSGGRHVSKASLSRL